MLLVDDLPVVLVVQGPLPELGADLLPDGLDQPVLDGRLAVEVVRRHAGLAAVEELPEDDPLGRQGDVGGAVHDAGALSPQLQGHRRQVLGGLPEHLPAHRLAAGEEDVVERLPEQALVLLPPAGDHRHIGGIEAGGDDLLDDGAGVGGVGAGLEHHGVPRRQGVGQGVHGQHEGVVPGAHDQDHPVGGGFHIAPGVELGQRGGDPPLRGEAPGVADHVGDLAAGQPHLAHVALKAALAQVRFQRGVDLRLTVQNGCPQALKGLDALFHGQRGAAGKVGPLRIQNMSDLFLVHFAPP